MDIWFTLFVLLVALLVAAGFALLLVGYIDTVPAGIAHGWYWSAITLLLPVAGPLYFCFKQGSEFARPARQLLGGVSLIALATLLLYGFGPHFAQRIITGAPVT